MKKLSIVFVNLAVLCTLLVLANAGAFIANRLLPVSVPQPNPPDYIAPVDYPNMAPLAWAATHFKELGKLNMDYRSFVGWRRKPFSGETINIDAEGIRASSDDPGGAQPIIGLFGGSTMWGTGVRDDGTIGSYINRLAEGRFRAVNYGETGFRSMQGYLTLLGEYQAGRKFSHVVFYDGVNEVYTGCRADLASYAHYFDRQYREIVDYFREAASQHKTVWEYGGGGSDLVPSAVTLVQPIVDLIDRLSGRPADSVLTADRVSTILEYVAAFDCDTNPQKAEAAAQLLIRSWTEAADLARREGSEFTAFLQPVAYFTTSNVDYLRLDRDANAQVRLKAQYEAVYPRIRALALEASAKYGFRFVDLSAVLDQPGVAYYIDFCHVSPNGNEVLARAIAAEALTGEM